MPSWFLLLDTNLRSHLPAVGLQTPFSVRRRLSPSSDCPQARLSICIKIILIRTKVKGAFRPRLAQARAPFHHGIRNDQPHTSPLIQRLPVACHADGEGDDGKQRDLPKLKDHVFEAVAFE